MIKIPIAAKVSRTTGKMELTYAEIEEKTIADFFVDAYMRLPLKEKEAIIEKSSIPGA